MMLRVTRLFQLFLISTSLASVILAATPTSFCKCTCFSNSTIIQLGPPESSASSQQLLDPRDQADFLYIRGKLDDDVQSSKNENDTSSNSGSGEKEDDKKFRALNCNDCNRKFCLDYQLPKCKGATEEDVFTTCFQRDSSKDKAVVFIFIIATSGLLAWAAIKPWAKRWSQSARERRSYLPIVSQDEER